MANKLLTISVRSYLVRQPRTKRMRKIAYYLRDRIAHYTKTDIDKVKFGRDLSNALTAHAKRMTPLKLSIDVDKGITTATLFKEAQQVKAAPKQAEQKKQPAAAEKKEQQAKKAAPSPEQKPAQERPRQPGAAKTSNSQENKEPLAAPQK
jgi:ribosomal protein L31E